MCVNMDTNDIIRITRKKTHVNKGVNNENDINIQKKSNVKYFHTTVFLVQFAKIDIEMQKKNILLKEHKKSKT